MLTVFSVKHTVGGYSCARDLMAQGRGREELATTHSMLFVCFLLVVLTVQQVSVRRQPLFPVRFSCITFFTTPPVVLRPVQQESVRTQACFSVRFSCITFFTIPVVWFALFSFIFLLVLFQFEDLFFYSSRLFSCVSTAERRYVRTSLALPWWIATLLTYSVSQSYVTAKFVCRQDESAHT